MGVGISEGAVSRVSRDVGGSLRGPDKGQGSPGTPICLKLLSLANSLMPYICFKITFLMKTTTPFLMIIPSIAQFLQIYYQDIVYLALCLVDFHGIQRLIKMSCNLLTHLIVSCDVCLHPCRM